MIAVRRIVTGCLALMAAAALNTGAQALEGLDSCYGWKAYSPLEVSPVQLSNVKLLDIRHPLRVSLFGKGNFTKEFRVWIAPGRTGRDYAEAGFLPVRTRPAPRDDHSHTLVRLPTGAHILDSDTGERLPHAEFRLLGAVTPLTDLGTTATSALTCLERLVGDTLVPSMAPEIAGRDSATPPMEVPAAPSILDLRPALGDDSDVAHTPRSRLSDFVVAPSTAPAPNGLGKVCDATTGMPLDWDVDAAGFSPEGTVVAGVRNDRKTAPVLQYNAVVDDVFSRGDDVQIRSVPRHLDPLQVVKTGRDGSHLKLFARPLHDDVLALHPDDASEHREIGLNVAVIGDPKTVAISGLEGLDDHLRSMYETSALRIGWYRVESDGGIQPPRHFRFFTEVVADAERTPETDVNYSSAEALNRFADQLVGHAVSATDRVDMIIWVLEGVMLPDAAPAVISDAIRRISKDGMVPRFDDGQPRRWLHVIAGRFAQTFSESYLHGPIIRANPPIGDLVIESRESGAGGTLRRFLSEDEQERLGGHLLNQFRRNQPSLPASQESGSVLVVDVHDAYSRVGIIVTSEMLEQVDEAARGVHRLISDYRSEDMAPAPNHDGLDLSALLLLRTDENGLPKGLRAAGTANPLTSFEKLGILENYRALASSLVSQIESKRERVGEECQFTFLTLAMNPG